MVDVLLLQALAATFGVWLILGLVCVFPYVEYRKSQDDDSPFVDDGPLMRPFATLRMLLDIDMYQPRPLQIALWVYRLLTAICLIAVLIFCAQQIRKANLKPHPELGQAANEVFRPTAFAARLSSSLIQVGKVEAG